MQWSYQNEEHWQTLLNDDSVVNFVNRSETPDQLKSANITFCARYLDMPISWVKQFSVSNAGISTHVSFEEINKLNKKHWPSLNEKKKQLFNSFLNL